METYCIKNCKPLVFEAFRYLALSFVNLCTMIYVIISFVNNEQIEADTEYTKKWISAIVGVLLETSSFIYTWLLPLKIAKDITDKKLKSFNR